MARIIKNNLNIVKVFFLLVLSITSVLLFLSYNNKKTQLSAASKQRDAQVNMRISIERKILKKDLTEKYNADVVSFMAMEKRIELEKQKRQELEKKMELKK